MSIDEVFRYVNAVLNKNQTGAISPDEFNRMAKVAQDEAFNERVGLIMSRASGAEYSQKIIDELLPITVQESVEKNAQGLFDIPEDYARLSNWYAITYTQVPDSQTGCFENISLVDATRQLIRNRYYKVVSNTDTPISIEGTPTTVGQVFEYISQTIAGRGQVVEVTPNYNLIDLIGGGDLIGRLGSYYTGPSLDYPIGQFRSENNTRIAEVWPKDIDVVHFEYYRQMEDPVWGFTLVNNEPVYDPASSTQLSLGETAHNDIANKILYKYGVAVDDTLAAQYAQQKEAMGS